MSESRRRFGRWALGALDACAIALILLLAMRLLMRQRPWPVELAANGFALMLVPSVVILIVFVVLKQWKRAALWGLPAVTLVGLFGGLLLPSSAPATSGKTIRVMSYNLFGINYRTIHRSPQMRLMRDSGADIIALQEVNPASQAAIEARLADLYPYRILYPGGVGGTGILSKFPFSYSKISELNSGVFSAHAIVDVHGIPVHVISAHPPGPIQPPKYRYSPRGTREVTALLKLLPEGEPLLLMGDFNHTDQSSDYQLMREAGLADTFREVGFGFGPTWPNRAGRLDRFAPFLRIDYIWHSAHFKPLSATVGPATTSDHSPVIAELVLLE